MKETTLRRKPVVLSESTQRRLGMYTLAASAAAVSISALVQPAEAKVVYTPAHLVVKLGDRDCIDMNHDGKTDFCLAMNSHEGGCFVYALGGSYKKDGIAASTKGGGALPIRVGKRIGQSRNFILSNYFPQMVRMNRYCYTSIWSGLWVLGGKGNKGLTNRYLGIKFETQSKIHYGWARCSVYPQPRYGGRVVMTGYAYETIPNKPIVAGETKGSSETGLGRLALGKR